VDYRHNVIAAMKVGWHENGEIKIPTEHDKINCSLGGGESIPGSILP